jgi:glycosyltransferase involved in cell wall biosynthesis
MMGERRLSVVLPVYRNRACLPELHRRLSDALRPLSSDYELVFVDDAGGDGSAEWLRECRQRDPRVVLVELPRNGGQHRAVLAGLARSTGAAVVVMDADLQDPPEAIGRLVEALDRAGGVVFARRTSRHQSRGRHLTGRLFKRLLRRLSGSRVPAGTGMFFVAARPVVDAALASAADVRYVPLLLDATGAAMSAVDVVKSHRLDSPSAYTARRRLQLAAGAIRQALAMRRARKPATTAKDLHAREGQGR